jgi:hypothetical protein
MNDPNDPPFDDSEVQLDVVATDKCRQKRWAPIEVKDNHGKTIYPFLDDNNVKDLTIIRALLVERPFAAAYGQVTGFWDDFVVLMNNTMDINGSAVFDPPLKTKFVRDRFEKKFMPFVSKYDGKIPFRSGCDDEEVPSEIHQGLESLFSMWSDQKLNAEDTKDRAKMERKRGNAMSEAIRQAALGMFVPKPPPAAGQVKCANKDADYLVDIGFDSRENFDTPLILRSSSTLSSSSAEAMLSGGTTTNSATTFLLDRTQIKLQREESKKRKLALEERRLLLDEQRHLEEQKDKERRLLLDEQRHLEEQKDKERRLLLDEQRHSEEKKDREANRMLMLAMAAKIGITGDPK